MKIKTVYVCSDCGHEAARWVGQCPSCKAFNTMEEDVVEDKKNKKAVNVAERPFSSNSAVSSPRAFKIKEVSAKTDIRVKTGIAELDRAMSGGIVNGSFTLIGGEPGIGKSTLLLQICQSIETDGKILYLSGEESLTQLKIRAERLGIDRDNVYLAAETSLSSVDKIARDIEPKLMIIDSIQTVYSEESASAPGSVTQIKECASYFMKIAKREGVSVIMVGHVTKEGSIAGPRVLEHMVDTVVYFEGEKKASYRIIRVVKNRFGATDEIGVFEMREAGLVGIENPSEYMLAGRPLNAPGSVVTCNLEGSRPILTEVQALVTYTNFGIPRRVATGVDYNRVVMLIAALEKRAGLKLGNYDGYVNIAGGMKVTEPSIDLAIIAAITGSFKNKAVPPSFVAFGEVGLAGEVRAVNNADRRVGEAEKLGFKEIAVPAANLRGISKKRELRVYGIASINELIDLIL